MTDYPGSDDGRYGPRYGDAGWHRSAGRPGDLQRTGARLLAWLKSRPGESWAFFAAGFVLAAILT